MKCPKCEKENKKSAVKCAYCGHEFNTDPAGDSDVKKVKAVKKPNNMEKLITAVVIAAVILLVITVVFFICKNAVGGSEEESTEGSLLRYEEFPTGAEIFTVQIEKNPVATVNLEDGSKIVIELDYNAAPNTVTDFIAMANAKVYDGTAFNKVLLRGVVMMDDEQWRNDPPYYIMDENDRTDDSGKLSHTAGSVSMIKSEGYGDKNTGLFFILTEDVKTYDKHYTAFGTVIEGMDIVEKIASSERDDKYYLVSPYVIKSVTVDTFGVEFPYPTIIPNK